MRHSRGGISGWITLNGSYLIFVVSALLCDLGIANEIVVQSALTRIADSRDIAALQAGVLGEVFVHEGKIVTTGDPIAKVDDTVFRVKVDFAELEAAMANQEAKNDVSVRLAKKALAVATTEYERAQSLNAGIPGTVSERELNVLRLTRDKSELEIENAMHQLAMAQLTRQLREADADVARVDQQRCTISAPISGMVVHVEKHAGEWVDHGGLVARIVSVDRIRAEGYVSDAQAAQRLIGWKGILDLPGEAAMEGEVVFVSPEANPVDGRVRVWIDFDNRTARLRPGQPASVRLVSPTGN